MTLKPQGSSGKLPIALDYAPMEAKLVAELPEGPQWQYEPKWDGFRCLAFRDGDEIHLQSKAGQPLERYFPEVVEGLLALPAKRFVLDGELVVPEGKALSFDQLLQRIHPAASRVAKLARESPALYVVFDLLVDADGRGLVDQPLAQRREALEVFVAECAGQQLLRMSPMTTRKHDAQAWFRSVGAGLDGAVAKRRDLPYQSGERTGMQKYKRMRTADCVVGGFRYASKGGEVGSLLLGLYNDAGLLDHVGFASNLRVAERPAITRELEKRIAPPGFTGNKPGGPSRWSTARSSEWEPLATSLVAEVQYDHFSNGRFRHGTKFLRWRPDKAPGQCTTRQVEQEATGMKQLLESTRVTTGHAVRRR